MRTSEQVSASDADRDVVERLRAGDEAAFVELVTQLQGTMRRVARMYVSSNAVADEVVQEAWLGVLQGIDRFEGRASLKTWIIQIVSNIARTRGKRESRSVPFTTLAGDDLDAPTFDPSMFRGADDPEWPGHWISMRDDWRTLPEDRLLGAEIRSVIGRAVAELPPMQAEVLRLRDVEGWDATEVCNALDLTATNQRVLLHRARTKVRAAVDAHVNTA